MTSPLPSAEVAARSLAAAVRARRRELSLTQVDLALLAGCGPDFLYDLEAGKPTVRLDKVIDVLAILGLELRVTDGKRGLSVDARVDAHPDVAAGAPE